MHDGEAWAVGAQLCGREEEAHMVGPGLDPGLVRSQAVDMAVSAAAAAAAVDS